MSDPETTAAEILSGVPEWRAQHPHATFQEIETTVEAHLARLRAALLQQAAHTSPAADWSTADHPPACPHCGAALQARGAHTRRIQAPGGQEVVLTRQYATCPACGAGLFPPG
jgi:ribosomal protein S27AE